MAEFETLTAIGDVPGTLTYVSPERLDGETATHAADIWAVGAMLWEALARRHPFRAESADTTISTSAPARRRPNRSAPTSTRRSRPRLERALELDPRESPERSRARARIAGTAA